MEYHVAPMAFRVPSKKQTLLAFLERGVVMLHLNARRPGVVVPSQYAHEAHLRLNLSYRYSIPDLIVDDGYVQATLSFGGKPFRCQLPWPAIFGITSHESGDGQVWPEDLPVEVMQTLADRHGRERAPDGIAARAAPPLAALSDELRPAEQNRSPERPKQPDGAQRRHLHLVR
jgi:stringent starvation protein B